MMGTDYRSNRGIATLRYLALLIFVLVLAAGSLFIALRLSRYPSDLAAALRQRADTTELQPQERLTLEKDLIAFETDNRIKIWTAIVQAGGGLVLLLGLLFTWRNLRATQAKLDIDREGQLTNRFTQATGQLGAELKDGRPNMEVRLGGIYALARIGDDSPKDYWPVMDVLTAYVRHNAPWPPATRDKAEFEVSADHPTKPRTDIQAILTILGRHVRNELKFDLRRTDLRGAEFWDAHLENTDFWGAHLEGAQLWGANLNGAKLENASLEGANMRGAKLSNAVLTNACLRNSDLREADLVTTKGLTQEQVDSAYLRGTGASLPSTLPS